MWESCGQSKSSVSLLAFNDHRCVAHPQRTHTVVRDPECCPVQVPSGGGGYPAPEAAILNTSSNASFPAATLPVDDIKVCSG